MPCALLSTKSALLTTNGWGRVEAIPGRTRVFGVDRHGRLAFKSVQAERLKSNEATVFLGSTSAFGNFAGVTRILTYDGRVITAADLAESGRITDTCFDTIVDLPNGKLSKDFGTHIWDTIASSALFVGVGKVAVGCRDWKKISLSSFARKHGLCSIERVHGQAYIITRKSGFDSAVSENWAEAVLAVGRPWLHDSEHDREEVSRDNSAFGIWYLSALRELKIGFEVKYDSLQHTISSYIVNVGAPPRSVSRGRCVCYGHERSGLVRIAWEGSSWNPVASGFLTGPN